MGRKPRLGRKPGAGDDLVFIEPKGAMLKDFEQAGVYVAVSKGKIRKGNPQRIVSSAISKVFEQRYGPGLTPEKLKRIRARQARLKRQLEGGPLESPKLTPEQMRRFERLAAKLGYVQVKVIGQEPQSEQLRRNLRPKTFKIRYGDFQADIRNTRSSDAVVYERYPPARSMDTDLPWATEEQEAAVADREHLLSSDEISLRLDVTRETANRWRKEGKLLGFAIAKRGYLYPPEQINERGQLLPGLEQIIERFQGDHWAAWRFLAAELPELDGQTGFAAISGGKIDRLLNIIAARQHGSFT